MLIKLENLPEITEKALMGLKADDSLKLRILNAAVHKEKSEVPKGFRHLVPILISSVALMLVCIFLLNGKTPLPLSDQQLIYSFTAGNSDAPSGSFASFTETDPKSIKYIELVSSGEKKEGHAQLDQLIEVLKNNSELLRNSSIDMDDRLNIYGSNGILFSLPVKVPYIGWSDGIQKCELFFELLIGPKN